MTLDEAEALVAKMTDEQVLAMFRELRGRKRLMIDWGSQALRIATSWRRC